MIKHATTPPSPSCAILDAKQWVHEFQAILENHQTRIDTTLGKGCDLSVFMVEEKFVAQSRAHSLFQIAYAAVGVAVAHCRAVVYESIMIRDESTCLGQEHVIGAVGSQPG